MGAEGGRRRHGEGDDKAGDAERQTEQLAAAHDAAPVSARHEHEEHGAHDGAGDQQPGERQGDLDRLAGVLDVEAERLEQAQRVLEAVDDEPAGQHAGQPLEQAVGDRWRPEVAADHRGREQDGGEQGAGGEPGQRWTQAGARRAQAGARRAQAEARARARQAQAGARRAIAAAGGGRARVLLA